MINEEFIDAAKVHIKILIYKHIDKMGTTTDPGAALLSVCLSVRPSARGRVSMAGAADPTHTRKASWAGELLFI